MKRVYKTVAVAAEEQGFAVTLDGRPILTPGRRAITLPTRALADAIAGEWDAQRDEIDPRSMEMMGFAATVVDRVTPQRDPVIDEIAGFGGSDLLCFLADDPPELVAREVERWTPWRARLEQRLGITLAVTSGIMPVRQSPEVLATLRAAVDAADDWHLAVLHTATSISGSLVLGLAWLDGAVTAEEAFELSQIDETFQSEKWGLDREAELRRRNLLAEMQAAEKFKGLLAGENC